MLVDQSATDESVALAVLSSAQDAIEQGKYEEALKLLEDIWSYDEWKGRFGAEIVTGIAYCRLKISKEESVVNKSFEMVTEA